MGRKDDHWSDIDMYIISWWQTFFWKPYTGSGLLISHNLCVYSWLEIPLKNGMCRICCIPIGSMYGIFTYIYHKNQPNVIYIYQSHGWHGIRFPVDGSISHQLPSGLRNPKNPGCRCWTKATWRSGDARVLGAEAQLRGEVFFVTNGKFFVFLNHPWVWWENSTTLGFDENLTSFHQPLDLGVDCLFHDSEIGLYLSFLIFVLSVKCCTWGNSDVFSCSPVPLEINWDEVPMNIAG